MRSLMLVAACLAFAGHGRRVQAPNFQQQVKHVAEQMREKGDAPDVKALATLLLASSPSSAFTPSGPGTQPVTAKRNAGVKMSASGPSEETWASLRPTRVQGNSLKTWSFEDTDKVIVAMNSDDESLTNWQHEGRLMNVDLSLCEGPDNTPVQWKIKSSKGVLRPFKAVISTPGSHCSLFIRNIGTVEFPVTAGVAAQKPEDDFELVPPTTFDMEDPYELQGNSVKLYPIPSDAKRAKVHLSTNGRPLNAKIELLMGPNAVRYELDIYSEDGQTWPAFTIIETPGKSNSIRVVNTAPGEFPLTVDVQPL